MADFAFVVAFAHKGESEIGGSPQAMAAHLRNLLDTALKATPRTFSNNISVSVAPGGVMFALRDSNPDRAVALCQAVAGQLEHQAGTQHGMPAVCAVITHGLLRSLDVLGLSTNFEGWPAIAAARVLAKLSPGELAVEESAWNFTALREQCGDARTLPGKSHDAEAFHVCIHKRIHFPTPAEKPLAEELKPLHISSHGEFAQKVKDQIGTRLRDPRLQALHDAIVQQEKGATAAEDVLVPPHSTSLLAALTHLYQATKICLQKPLGAPVEQIARVKAVALEIFGLLTGLAVNRDKLRGSAWAFDPRQGSFEVTLPLVSEAAIEVGVSALGERAARFRRIKDPRNPRVVGQDSFSEEELEMGITTSDRLTELLKRIWVTVMEVEHAPEPFCKRERDRLQSVWRTRDALGRNCYYITLPQNSSSSQFDKALLQRLAEVLQPLRVIYFGAEQNQGLLFVNEYDLWALIEEFLAMVEKA